MRAIDKDKLEATIIGGIAGLLVWHFVSAAWGWAALFAIYFVLLSDKVLKRLQKLEDSINEIVSDQESLRASLKA